MAKHFKKVGTLPVSAVTPKGYKSDFFTDELVAELKKNPGEWFLVEGATPQGAAAWLGHMNGTETKNGKKTAKVGDFERASVKTDKTTTRKRDGKEFEAAVSDVYVRYAPSK